MKSIGGIVTRLKGDEAEDAIEAAGREIRLAILHDNGTVWRLVLTLVDAGTEKLTSKFRFSLIRQAKLDLEELIDAMLLNREREDLSYPTMGTWLKSFGFEAQAPRTRTILRAREVPEDKIHLVTAAMRR